jgi:uncharacterized phage-like protein YoqJ
MIIAFTGHRPDELGGYDESNPTALKVKAKIKAKLQELNPERVISGMALGVDIWAAEAAIELGIPVEAALPFVGQDKIWPEPSKARFQDILKKCKKVTVVSEGGYAAWKMHARNAYMVDNCDLLIAVWNGKQEGGTWGCIQYATKRVLEPDRLRSLSMTFLFEAKELNEDSLQDNSR